jgi:hypothetical protein
VALEKGDTLHGEIKSMNRGVLQLETDYSDSDFKIEWEKIVAIYSNRFFSISLSDGARMSGTIRMEGPEQLSITSETGEYTLSELKHIVYLKQVNQDFWSRMNASIDLGFSYSKNNNLTQLSTRSSLGYLTEKWQLDLNFNSVQSRQDSIPDVLRRETKLSYTYFLKGDWFIQGSFNFLSNTEQLLILRTTSKVGLGAYFTRTNSMYWNYGAGLASNLERFDIEDNQNRSTAEFYVSSEWNMFDAGDLKILLSANSYVGMTQRGRFRTDVTFDMKYDLPLDFYIGLGASLNYDNQPVEVEGQRAQETDYVTQLSFGWSL